ncbi:LL-diaminopimelate aminotransferase [Candidatus Margulisiibacteriota bacterium]
MVRRSENMAKLKAGYLFPEINRRKNKVLEEKPNAQIISLGIGNTTEPLSDFVVRGLEKAVLGMGTSDGYSGYGDEQGFTDLRKKIAENLYKGIVKEEEVFISDGAKCDIGRIQLLFGPKVKIAVQDPSYPVYVDGSVIMGATGNYNEAQSHFDNIYYMTCRPDNNFFPDLSAVPKVDLIYFCSPNNPTGAVSTREQLKELVDFAAKNSSIIIFDAAYSEFIKDKDLPKSIFEIEGARKVALEINSFSKLAGFTGVRLGWSIVPEELCYDDGIQVIKDWNRIMTTVFNGASNIVQYGGLAVLENEGWQQVRGLISYYMENARIIKEGLDSMGVTSYGGINSPYIWAEFPNKKSWDVFENILEEAFIVTTPGSGFGPGGEGFVRFSAFGSRDKIIEAVKRLQQLNL